jgi:excisionase family DNA binding protein
MAVHPHKPRRIVEADYVSVSEAAKLLSVHHKTVRAAIQRGDLTAVRLGDTLRIPIAALRALPLVEAEES